MKIIHAIIISLGLILAFLIFGNYFYAARANKDSISVTGAAIKGFECDIVKWRLTLHRSVGIDEMNQGYRMLKEDLNQFEKILAEKKIEFKAFNVQPVNSYEDRDRDGKITGHNINQNIFIITDNIAPVEELALNPVDLISHGIEIQNSNLQYYYSGIDSLKKELLSLAAQDARERADEIALGDDINIGKPRQLRAGVFQIKEPYSTEVSGYGMYSTHTRNKEIMVTVHATFEIY